MKQKLNKVSQRYVTVLRKHLKQGQHASLKSARGLGSRALAQGLQTLDLAKLHEQTLLKVLRGCPVADRPALIKQAGIFFAVAITPIEKTLRSDWETTVQKRFIETLSQRTVELAASNLALSQEITQRKAAEEALKK